MRLAPRLALSFGLLTVLSTTGVGLAVRHRFARDEEARFAREVAGVCERAVAEVKRQAEADRALVGAACHEGELADRLGIALDAGELELRGTGLTQLVPRHREAFSLDELVLVAEGGQFLAASPTTLLGMPRRDTDAALAAPTKGLELRLDKMPALVARCTKRSERGKRVGVLGARHLGPLLDRLGRTLDVRVVAPGAPPPGGGFARATCALADDAGRTARFDVLQRTTALEEKLRQIDESVLAALAASLLVALALAVLLARSLGRPLAELATEAAKVAGGEARPIAVRGTGEVAELARAFDRMIEDLAATRRRLAAASRIAAWREVARRVAHEIKNPLAPIRAAVETLRRLRAREDPRFDDYFDEATRTVLDEVHRISNIVTEFTRFARLPAPRPQDVDAEELARQVVRSHEATAETARVAFVAGRRGPLRADRDQVVQVLTNLIQNAIDAVKDTPDGSVTVTTDTDGERVTFTVADDGRGVAPSMAARLFEPYATDKASGTGLGLAIAQRIAVEHAGDLAYLGTSANGRGAVFRLTLPASGPPPAHGDDAPPST